MSDDDMTDDVYDRRSGASGVGLSNPTYEDWRLECLRLLTVIAPLVASRDMYHRRCDHWLERCTAAEAEVERLRTEADQATIDLRTAARSTYGVQVSAEVDALKDEVRRLTEPVRLDIICFCSCHYIPGVKHLVACCAWPPYKSGQCVDVVITQHPLGGIMIRIQDKHAAEEYASMLEDRSRLAHGRVDVGFADDAQTLREAIDEHWSTED